MRLQLPLTHLHTGRHTFWQEGVYVILLTVQQRYCLFQSGVFLCAVSTIQFLNSSPNMANINIVYII